MRTAFRKLATWIVTLSLVSGSLVPFTAAATADADGVCGPVLVLAHSTEHFEAPLPPIADHCVLCHLWQALASGSVSNGATVAPPEADGSDQSRAPSDRYDLIAFGESSPRGPPARA